MQRARKLVTTVQTHWKKSLVAAGVAAYGARWALKKQEEHELMKGLCQEAMRYGAQPIKPSQPLYHVTVILNPRSNGGKGRKMYEKYCAPLLHLAGIKVSVKITESEGEAKDLMEIMENTDAVLIAGGDGTMSEAVTGLMRREDMERYRLNVPLGILPVGENNSLAKRLFGDQESVPLMAEATMSVVRQLMKPLHLIELQNLSNEEQFHGRKVYGTNCVKMGAWREAEDRKETYWFLPGLKYRATYVLSFLTGRKEVNWVWPFNIFYRTVTSHDHEVEKEVRSSGGGGLFSWFHGRDHSTSQIMTVKETVHQESWHTVAGGGSSNDNGCNDEDPAAVWTGGEIDISIQNDGGENGRPTMLKVQLFPEAEDIISFVQAGFQRVKGLSAEPELELASDNLLLTPKWETEAEKRALTLDGDEIDIRGPFRVSLLRDQVTVFCKKGEETLNKLESKNANSSMWGTFKGTTASATSSLMSPGVANRAPGRLL